MIFLHYKLAKKYSRNSRYDILYLLIGPFAIIILILIGRKSEDSYE